MKILFIHGLASSGAYKTADTLRILLRQSTVISPDIPIDAAQALKLLKEICSEEKPDLIVGLSLGGFWAQKLRGYKKILINPDFHISRLMRTMTGEVKYLSPRKDGSLSFTLTKEICDAYEELEKSEFDNLTEDEIKLTVGMFANHDEMVNCYDEFQSIYGSGIRYPGAHLPTFPEIKNHLLPLVEKMIL